jgi:hypothetical protein
MSDKSGRSEEKEDFWGNKYTQNYDKDGNKTGWSEQKEGFWGNQYTQNYDEDNNKTGRAEDKEDFWGHKYEQQYNEDNDKTGWNEDKESFWGNKYEQHYNEDDDKTGWSERKEGFWGNKYTQHYDNGASSRSSTYSSPSNSSTSSSYSGSSGSSASIGSGYSTTSYATSARGFSSSSRPSSDAFGSLFKNTGRALLTGIVLYPVIGLGGCITRIVAQGPPPNPMTQTQAHDVWLHSPLQSWTTEAIIIPLLITAITFFISLIKIRQANPVLTVSLFLLGIGTTIYVGSGLTSLIRKDTTATPTVNNSSQAGIIGTMREVNTINLNMRSGPGATYPVVATFPRKARIVSYGETRNVDSELWTQASTPDGQTRGWVNRKYLSP